MRHSFDDAFPSPLYCGAYELNQWKLKTRDFDTLHMIRAYVKRALRSVHQYCAAYILGIMLCILAIRYTGYPMEI